VDGDLLGERSSCQSLIFERGERQERSSEDRRERDELDLRRETICNLDLQSTVCR
jgi:hypothetical protein